MMRWRLKPKGAGEPSFARRRRSRLCNPGKPSSADVMHEHRATVSWARGGSDFLNGKYSREHLWRFDGGAIVPASASPSNVPSPYSNPANVDPEEAFVAAVSSCHMLTFLFLAYKEGFQIDSYQDEAIGVMTKNGRGAAWVSVITLQPQIVYSGEKLPTPTEEDRLHHLAHEQCFIANSIKTEVSVRAARV
jgi:organic hydroperoxide reductase OsmC/OhrA